MGQTQFHNKSSIYIAATAKSVSCQDEVSADAGRKRSKAVTGKLMAIRYLLDEHLNPTYRSQLVRRNPELVVRIIGD
ncbi:MAG: hypothetical protein V7K67_26220 [Nostoc sp.]|uniref:hypothetical protein n=1 Tax=Nostoc sp. TaxID=1180 RepID=UPI002FF7C157